LVFKPKKSTLAGAFLASMCATFCLQAKRMPFLANPRANPLFWPIFKGAAAGLSGLLRGCRKAGPAGLRGLLRSPPHLAGQASASLRGSLVNPCRWRPDSLGLPIWKHARVLHPAAGIDAASLAGAGWLAKELHRSDLGSYLFSPLAPILYCQLARKARRPPQKTKSLRIHKT